MCLVKSTRKSSKNLVRTSTIFIIRRSSTGGMSLSWWVTHSTITIMASSWQGVKRVGNGSVGGHRVSSKQSAVTTALVLIIPTESRGREAGMEKGSFNEKNCCIDCKVDTPERYFGCSYPCRKYREEMNQAAVKQVRNQARTSANYIKNHPLESDSCWD